MDFHFLSSIIVRITHREAIEDAELIYCSEKVLISNKPDELTTLVQSIFAMLNTYDSPNIDRLMDKFKEQYQPMILQHIQAAKDADCDEGSPTSEIDISCREDSIEDGDQPPGTMARMESSVPVEGYPGCGHIKLIFAFPGGYCSDAHRYFSPRTQIALFPDNPEGRVTAALFQWAFDKKHLYSVGYCLGDSPFWPWSRILIKTGEPEHNYPDQRYLGNVCYALGVMGFSIEHLPKRYHHLL